LLEAARIWDAHSSLMRMYVLGVEGHGASDFEETADDRR
jgi:hypothetical protein